MTVIQFKRKLREIKPSQKEVNDHFPIAHVMLAIAYYVTTEVPGSARSLLRYVSAYDPLPEEVYLPDDLAQLVQDADLGQAMFPEG